MSALTRIGGALRGLLGMAAGRGRHEAGDSLIEVTVSALLGALVIAVTAAVFASGNDHSYAAQRESALVEVANQQMENIRQLVKADGFSALALSSLPATASSAAVKFDSATPLDPNSFVTTCGATAAYDIETNYDNTASGLVASLPNEPPCGSGVEPLITGGSVSPNPPSVTVGGMTVTLDEYVTEASVGCNTSLGTGSCTDDARRVTVAAVDSQAQTNCSNVSSTNTCLNGADAPVYLSTIFTNPTPSNAPNSSAGITLGLQLG